MASPETILAQAAADASFDISDPEAWPKTLQYILDRLEEIYNNDFPKPPSAPSDPLSPSPAANANWTAQSLSRTASNQGVNPSSQESHPSQATDKENARPVTPPQQNAPAAEGAHSTPQPDRQGIPAEIVARYNYIRKTLTENFANEPPHTLQRLAELILEPKKHYRFLPSYLRALDRTVSVTSPSTVFPLPLAVLPGGLLNSRPPTPPSSLGSDESLGGALLTPIPWLQNRSQSELVSESTEMVEGPNGAGRIETVSVMNGQLTSVPSQQPQQQHLQQHSQAQEQEAGILVSHPHSIQPGRSIMGEAEGGGIIMATVEDQDEVPHARGPEVIGLEDTGPQKGGSSLDIEGAVGRPSIERSSRSPNPPATTGEGADAAMREGKEGEAQSAATESTTEASADQQMKDGEGEKEKEEQQPQAQDQKADQEMKE